MAISIPSHTVWSSGSAAPGSPVKRLSGSLRRGQAWMALATALWSPELAAQAERTGFRDSGVTLAASGGTERSSFRQDVSVFASHVSLLGPHVGRRATAFGISYHLEPRRPSFRVGATFEWQTPTAGIDLPWAATVEASLPFRAFGLWEPLVGIELGYTNAAGLEPSNHTWPASLVTLRERRVVPWYVGVLTTLLRFRHSFFTAESLGVRWAMMGLDAHLIRLEVDFFRFGAAW